MSLFSSRSKWTSNFAYILAAIGCAAGLGNLWRFPMLAYEHGGAAFIIALILSNLLIVFPLVMMETVIGQKFQLAAPSAFEKFKKGSSWIQWIAIFGLFLVLTYYTPIMAWGIKYFFATFSGAFLVDPAGYFTSTILHLTEGVTEMGGFQWSLLGALIFGYAIVIWALRKNVASLSGVIKITATAPFVFLLIMIIRGVTLPGSSEGLALFFIPDWSAFGDIGLWKDAISQSFFSASLAMGYYFIAGSHRKEGDELPKTTLLILAGNLGVSLLAGLAVFSTLGFMAVQQGVGVSEVSQGGPMLVFSVLPTAISMMPTGVIFFAALLFLIIFTLAIDSIFGIVESIAGAFHDMRKGKEKRFFGTMVWSIVIIILFSLPYLFGAGLYYLDIIDHFIGGYVFLLVGILESAVVAYVVGAENVRVMINKCSNGLRIPKLFNVFMNIIPVLLSVLFVWTLYKETQEVYGGYPMEYIILLGFVPLGLVLIASIISHFLGRSK